METPAEFLNQDFQSAYKITTIVISVLEAASSHGEHLNPTRTNTPGYVVGEIYPLFVHLRFLNEILGKRTFSDVGSVERCPYLGKNLLND